MIKEYVSKQKQEILMQDVVNSETKNALNVLKDIILVLSHKNLRFVSQFLQHVLLLIYLANLVDNAIQDIS